MDVDQPAGRQEVELCGRSAVDRLHIARFDRGTIVIATSSLVNGAVANDMAACIPLPAAISGPSLAVPKLSNHSRRSGKGKLYRKP